MTGAESFRKQPVTPAPPAPHLLSRPERVPAAPGARARHTWSTCPPHPERVCTTPAVARSARSRGAGAAALPPPCPYSGGQLDPRPGHACCPLPTPCGCMCYTQSVKNLNKAREASVRVRSAALLRDGEGARPEPEGGSRAPTDPARALSGQPDMIRPSGKTCAFPFWEIVKSFIFYQK